MKTKSEILEEFGCPTPDFHENVTMYYPAIHSAMDEYAQTIAIEFAEWIYLWTFYYSENEKVWYRDVGSDDTAFTESELFAKFMEERSKG